MDLYKYFVWNMYHFVYDNYTQPLSELYAFIFQIIDAKYSNDFAVNFSYYR